MADEPPVARHDTNRIRAVFFEAIEASPDKRQSVISRTCAGNPDFEARVRELLEAHDRSESFMSSPTLGEMAIDVDEVDRREPADCAGRAPPGAGPAVEEHIGPYHLIERVGEGGFGVVYLARQETPIRREVAIKVIKPGMDTRRVIARFEAERQALALMDHPNIAKVLDAGSTDRGRPYFVMELVRGVPLTAYCDANHLDVRGRLELFVAVCQAVQHAHQKGVIHGDIKPSNVLVARFDGRPAVKVIDFGIARAVAESSVEQATLTGQPMLVATPMYMSPEQSRPGNTDIDTRSDVYSLGVVLYELLAGVTPFDGRLFRTASLEEIQRIVRDVSPPRPSERTTGPAGGSTEPCVVPRELRGELDWIVMKAIEKDRTRRYATASALAEDVTHYLDDDPVAAGPPSAWYRASKIIRRHRLTVSATLAVALLLVLAVAALAVGLRRVASARDRAQRAEHDEAEQKAQALDRLWNSQLASARAGRFSGRPGQRVEGLRALAMAANYRSDLALRNEAIGCLALVDVAPTEAWDYRAFDDGPTAFDGPMARYAHFEAGGDIRLFRRSDRHELMLLPGHGNHSGNYLKFSPHGRYLAASYSSGNPNLRAWDLTTGRSIELPGPTDPFDAFDFTPDDRAVVMAGPGGTIELYEMPSARRTASFVAGAPVERICMDPQGAKIAAWIPSLGLQIRALNSGTLLTTLHPPLPELSAMSWNPDGRRIALTGDSRDNSVFVLDSVGGGQPVAMRGHLSMPVNVTFTHGGDVLLTGAWDGTARAWDAATGYPLLTIGGFGGLMQIADDDSMLEMGGTDYVQAYRLVTRRAFRSFAGASGDGWNFSAAFSPDGRLLAAANGWGARIWAMDSSKTVGALIAPGMRSILFTPDGSELVATTPQGIQRWPLPSRPDPNIEGAGTLPTQQTRLTGAAALSANGHTFVFSSPDNAVNAGELNDLASAIPMGRHSDVARFVAVSPDGAWAASSSRFELVFKVWDVKRHQWAADIPSGSRVRETAAVAFSPDGRWLVTGDPSAYSWWEVGTWKPHHRILRDRPIVGSVMVFTPDGKLMAASGPDYSVLLIDPATGDELASLAVPQPHSPMSLAFSHDGGQLAVTSSDAIVTVWDLGLIRRELAAMHLNWGPSK
ncbi:MAG TPA: WD40 repeat domain-containing serine/threonine protein kinase [Tepidisphaeraceae bacterium]|jgi:serine/threonine protein kinase/WD40 repeat protein|nr:WD40 repeat domain-containing serine/threonine protein kinase [Tepidisphaeraceae bacterium]